MQSFKEYYDKEEIKKLEDVESKPKFKIKKNMSSLINSFLSWLNDNKQESIKNIKNEILSFKRNLENSHEYLINQINNKVTLYKYLKLYKKLNNILEKFDDPKLDIQSKIDKIIDLLQKIYYFINAEIKI